MAKRRIVNRGKTKIKDHKGGRIWLEGAKPFDAGFQPGVNYRYNVYQDAVIIAVDVCGDRVVSGKGKRAIIDICNSELGTVFGLGTAMAVEYQENFIKLVRA